MRSHRFANWPPWGRLSPVRAGAGTCGSSETAAVVAASRTARGSVVHISTSSCSWPMGLGGQQYTPPSGAAHLCCVRPSADRLASHNGHSVNVGMPLMLPCIVLVCQRTRRDPVSLVNDSVCVFPRPDQLPMDRQTTTSRVAAFAGAARRPSPAPIAAVVRSRQRKVLRCAGTTPDPWMLRRGRRADAPDDDRR
jgi:hypothetical protein